MFALVSDCRETRRRGSRAKSMSSLPLLVLKCVKLLYLCAAELHTSFELFITITHHRNVPEKELPASSLVAVRCTKGIFPRACLGSAWLVGVSTGASTGPSVTILGPASLGFHAGRGGTTVVTQAQSRALTG